MSDSKAKKWYAVYVRPKSEKAVQHMLQQKGIEAYVPLRSVVRQYTRKRRTVHLPLISCYVFVKASSEQFVPILQTDHVLWFVKFANELSPIPEKEIQTMQRVVGELQEVDIQRIVNWSVGEEVEVIGGNLTGIRGLLLEKKRKDRFVVRLETLGFDIPVQINSKWLRLVG